MHKWFFKLIGVLGVFLGIGICQTTQLTGNIKTSDGTPFNGQLVIQLTYNGVKNICTTPFQSVPTLTVNLKVVNGVLQNTSSHNFLSQDCMSPRVPYYQQLYDSNNNLVSSDNWYLPRTASGLADVGAMQEQHFTGPITVAIPYGIISVPSASQSITQPSGTSMDFYGVVNFHGAVNFATPPFTIPAILTPTQILVNGATGSNPVEVSGFVDSNGLRFSGSGGTAGQCLVSNGTAFLPGTCPTPGLPTLYYQTIINQGSTLAQRGRTIYNDGSISVVDDVTNNSTDISLTKTGPGNLLLGLNSGIAHNTNCLQGDGNGGIVTTNNPCYYPTTATTLDQWKTITGCSFPGYSNLNSCFGTFAWPVAFADNNYYTVCTANSGNGASVIVGQTGTITASGFSFVATLVMENSSGSGWQPQITCYGHHN